MKDKPDFTGNELESYETQRLLDHDTLAQNYEEVSHELTIVPRYTTRATLQICKFKFFLNDSSIYFLSTFSCHTCR